MISVVIPVKDALIQFRQMYQSLAKNSSLVREIIIVDDCSNRETKQYIANLDVSVYTSQKHLWTNRAWNVGVSMAKEKYVAVLNSDIILSEGWDEKLVSDLKGDIVSPYNPSEFHQKYFPGMINGACFLFSNRKFFPIKHVYHWFGDNILSKYQVSFSEVEIEHSPESSARLLDKKEYWTRVNLDSKIYYKMDRSEGVKKILGFTEAQLAKYSVSGDGDQKQGERKESQLQSPKDSLPRPSKEMGKEQPNIESEK